MTDGLGLLIVLDRTRPIALDEVELQARRAGVDG